MAWIGRELPPAVRSYLPPTARSVPSGADTVMERSTDRPSSSRISSATFSSSTEKMALKSRATSGTIVVGSAPATKHEYAARPRLYSCTGDTATDSAVGSVMPGAGQGVARRKTYNYGRSAVPPDSSSAVAPVSSERSSPPTR